VKIAIFGATAKTGVHEKLQLIDGNLSDPQTILTVALALRAGGVGYYPKLTSSMWMWAAFVLGRF
jgi:uncharacterized protein YcbK (DUF882 family)